MSNFETGIYTAQIFDNHAHLLLAPPSILDLTVPVAETSPLQCDQVSLAQTGGPFALAQLDAEFFIGINDPLGLNPCGTAFSADIFDLYASWATLRGSDPRRGIASRSRVVRSSSIPSRLISPTWPDSTTC